jgi:hypothetical protein
MAHTAYSPFWGQIFVTEHDLLWVVVRSLCVVRYMRDLYFNQIVNPIIIIPSGKPNPIQRFLQACTCTSA